MFKLNKNILILGLIIVLIIILFYNIFLDFKKYKPKYELFDNFTWANNGIAGTTESGAQGSLICAKSCCYSGWPASIDID